jgi:hypothetical protein
MTIWDNIVQMQVELAVALEYLHSNFFSQLRVLIFIRACLHIYEGSKDSPQDLC